MEIVPIFATDICLLTINFEKNGIDEFTKLQDEWTDIEFLEDFFTTNQTDLVGEWKNYSIEDAVIKTRNDARIFFKFLLSLSKKSKKERIKIFKNLFHPLSKGKIEDGFLPKKKAYGSNAKTWLRIYALKIGEDSFLVTGGAIKLTRTMNEREHTMTELIKIDRCKQYLKDMGVLDEDGMIELMEIG